MSVFDLKPLFIKIFNLFKFINLIAKLLEKSVAGKISAKGLQGVMNLYGKTLLKATSKALPGAIARNVAGVTAIDQFCNFLAEFLKGHLS